MTTKLRIPYLLVACVLYYGAGRAAEIAIYLRLVDEHSWLGKALIIVFMPVFYVKSLLYNAGLPG